MNPFIYLLLIAGLIYTIIKFVQLIKGENVIPPRFFLSWSFILNVLGMLFIAVAVFYAKYPLTEIDIYIALIVGLILGLINATIQTGKKKTALES